MVMNIHHEIARSLDLKEIANEFASKNERRLSDFGKFTLVYIRIQRLVCSI